MADFGTHLWFNVPPVNAGVTPSSGGALTQTFSFQFLDANGAADLINVSLLFNATLTTVNGCAVSYDAPLNTLTLLTDAGMPAASIAPGSGSLQNSQCQLSGAGSSVSLAGNVLTLNVTLTFQSAFIGPKTVYMQSTSSAALTVWQPKGAWVVPSVTVQSLLPSSGTGMQQGFTLDYADNMGAGDFASVWVWFNPGAPTASSLNSCLLYYNRATNQVNLLNDAANVWIAETLGGTGAVTNSQCSVAMNSVSVSSNANDLLFTLTVAFRPGFSGTKNIFAYGAGSTANSGWRTAGTWSIPAPSVSVISLQPSSGSGAQQTFTVDYADNWGAADLASVWVWFNAGSSTASSANSCLLYYNRAANQLNMLNDAANVWMTQTPGGTGVLSNSQCSIAMSSVSTTGNSTDLLLTFTVAFKAAFGGLKNAFAYGADSSANSGWQTAGTWTVPAASLSVVSVQPSSGSGIQQSFTVDYADSWGTADLTTVWIWFNAGPPTASSAGSCLLYYNRTANQLNLLNDAANVWMAQTPGGTGALSNSQCSVNMSSVSITITANNLLLTLPMIFKPGFSGAKNIFGYAACGTGNTGWQAAGTWNIPAAAVSIASLSPTSGSGTQQTFTVDYTDTWGAADLTTVWVWFNAGASTASSANSCLLYYNRAANQLNMLNDAANVWMTQTPGGTGALSNSQCSVNMSSVLKSLTANDLLLTFTMTFKSAYNGAKSVFAYAAGSAATSGWQTAGAWTAQ